MQYNVKVSWRSLWLTFALIASCVTNCVVMKGGVSSGFQRSEGENNAAAQSKSTTPASKKPQATDQKNKRDPKSEKDRNNEFSISPQEQKKQQAITLLEGVLANAHRIEPVEYRVLTQVEAGTQLYTFDKERSIALFKSAFKTMRQLLDEEKPSKPTALRVESRRQRIWFFTLRKIAAVNPALLQALLLETSSSDKSKRAIKDEWTDEARAIISVAADQIEKDPKLAARLAQQSLAFGLVDWAGFLNRLGKQDRNEAERLAMALIDRLRDSSISPIELRNLSRYIFIPEQSSSLQEYYFQSLVIRLRRDVRSDIPTPDLEDDLSVARGMSRFALSHSPDRQPEFDALIYEFEALFNARSSALPAPPERRMMDVSTMLPASPGDTQKIADALPQVGAIKDLQARDREYQKLAAKAAQNADVSLAEDILSRMSDADFRRESTLLVYGPLVRKAINEADWPQAQKYATVIQEPLGRTLTLDRIAQAMAQAHQDKLLVLDVYATALVRLDHDESTEKVAKAFLMIAKSLDPIDRERSQEAITSAIATLNRLWIKGESPGDSTLGTALSTWVRLPNYSVAADEVLDLTDMVESLFRGLAKRDADKALSVALRFSNSGLYSIAQLAISRELFAAAKPISSASQPKKVARQ